MDRTTFVHPLSERYASKEMQEIFSSQYKFSTWRKLWVALAESEKELGLPITEEQINEMKENVEKIDFEKAAEYEKKLRHDVMAHVHTFGDACPHARAIIHLGATSAFVQGNGDLVQIKEALGIIEHKLATLIFRLAQFADRYKEQRTLGFTHFQPAQLTTVGKRATLWIYDFYEDLLEVKRRKEEISFRGVKGTTGTQASFLKLFEGDHEKVKQLDRMVAEKMGFQKVYPVTGQTEPRKMDFYLLSPLVGLAQSAHKFTNDIRLLQHKKELEEPFGKNQIGSSAMAYKRNPMRSERVASIARYIINDIQNLTMTASTQWLERTLDDSANRRMTIPEMFLAADGMLDICINIASGIVVYPKVIEKHVNEELPFMITENIIMESVKQGHDRQEVHEQIRQHSMAVTIGIKEEGKENDLLKRIAKDPVIGLSMADIQRIIDHSSLTGRAAEQVTEFLEDYIYPVLKEYQKDSAYEVELKV